MILKGLGVFYCLSDVPESAINAKELQVTFNKAVDESTVINTPTNTNLINITATPIGGAQATGQLTGELSKDGKVLTITATNTFDGQYAITVPTAVQTTDGKSIEAYSNIITAKDTTRPTLKSVSYDYQGGNRVAILEFSEPVDDNDLAVSAARIDGVDLNVGTTLDESKAVANGNKVTITLDAVNAADQNKDIKLTLTGLKDFAGNLATPNPLTTTIKLDTTDQNAPKASLVSVKDNNTLTVKFDKALSAKPADTSFKIKGAGAAGADLDSTTVTKVDAYTYDVAFAAGLPAGLQTLILPQVTDTNGNDSTGGENKLITINLDEAAPTLQSSKVEKIDGKEYLVLTYDENVTPANGINVDLEYQENYVSKTAQITTSALNFTQYKPVNGNSKSVKLDLSTLNTSAAYTAKLNAGLVNDLNGNASEVKTGVTFTRTADVVSGKPDVTLIDTAAVGGTSITDNNIVEITFDKKVDPQSALNKANYSIEGAEIESIKLTDNGATAVIELKLVDGSSKFTGDRTVKVSGVKSEAGDVMDAHTEVVPLNENVAPTVTSAVLTATDEVTLTFSESVTTKAVTTDFELLIGGKTVATNDTVTTAAGTGKTVVLTLEKAVETADVSAGLSLKPLSTLDIEDAAGNKLSVPANVVITQ